jgi:sugar (pentulose or hexulose) kinase
MTASPRLDLRDRAKCFGALWSGIRPHTHETSGLGAAIDCALGLGLHRDLEQAVTHMTRIGRQLEPNAANVATCDALYERVYRRIH